MRHNWLAVAALLFVAGSWGATFPLVKSILQDVAPEPFMFLRFSIAGVALLVLAAARRSLARTAFIPGIALGILVFAGYWMQTRGLLFVSPSRSAFLTGLYVVMVPFADRVVYRTRVSALDWAASVIAGLGMASLMGGLDARPTVGDVLTLLCAVCFAFHVVLSARWSREQPAVGLAAVQVLFVAVGAAIPAAFMTRPNVTPELAMVILFTALVTTALAFIALMWGQARVSATEAAVILAFEPVAAAITSIVFYGERMSIGFMAGGMLIVIAMIVSQLPEVPVSS